MSIWEILDYVEISSVESEVHVHEWMQLFLSGCISSVLY